MDKRMWVKKMPTVTSLSLVAEPYGRGMLRLKVMPGTWNPEREATGETPTKKPNAILYVTAGDLIEMLAMVEVDDGESNAG